MDLRDKVVRSFRTIREMLRDRALYNSSACKSYPEFDAIEDGVLEREALRSIFVLGSLDRTLFVVYSLQAKFKPLEVRRLMTAGEILPGSTVILVAYDKPSSINVNTLRATIPAIQIFELAELMYNVTEHVLVPRHEVVDEAENEELMTRLNVKARSQLPHIIADDPVARYLSISPGQIVKITRRSPSAGTTVFYRSCV